jgi:hypothetical protein
MGPRSYRRNRTATRVHRPKLAADGRVVLLPDHPARNALQAAHRCRHRDLRQMVLMRRPLSTSVWFQRPKCRTGHGTSPRLQTRTHPRRRADAQDAPVRGHVPVRLLLICTKPLSGGGGPNVGPPGRSPCTRTKTAFKRFGSILKVGKRIRATIRQLGYQTKDSLKAWYREYERCHDLRTGYVRAAPKYSAEQGRLPSITIWIMTVAPPNV